MSKPSSVVFNIIGSIVDVALMSERNEFSILNTIEQIELLILIINEQAIEFVSIVGIEWFCCIWQLIKERVLMIFSDCIFPDNSKFDFFIVPISWSVRFCVQ